MPARPMAHGEAGADRHAGRSLRITDQCQASLDVVARHGHDEFAVVLPEMTEEDGRRLVEQLHERFGAMEFAGGEVRLTAGTAHVKPDETLTAEAFLRRGEQALHEAKRYERGWSTMWESGARLLPRS